MERITGHGEEAKRRNFLRFESQLTNIQVMGLNKEYQRQYGNFSYFLYHPYKKEVKEKKEKSLGVLAFNFMRLLRVNNTITIEKAAEILSLDKMDQNKFKTKVRLNSGGK